MAGKFKRVVVGSICKSKDPEKPDYIKMRDDVVLKKNQTLRLESKKFQLASLESAVSAGKIGGEVAEKVKERINSLPEWIRFEVVMLEENK